MMPTQWEVTKYGQLIERADIEIKGIAFITTKIYRYKDKYYQDIIRSYGTVVTAYILVRWLILVR